MPAITLGLAEIEARLRLTRRRLNGLALQHAVNLGGSLAALACALLIVLALRDRSGLFAVTFWAILAVIGLALAVAARRVAQGWLSLADVAHRIDATAGLEERLSTALGCAAQLERSSLGPLLVHQLLSLSPRWALERIAPRRVPRSIWLLIASLAVLLTTAVLERRPPPPDPPARLARAQRGRDVPADSPLPGAQPATESVISAAKRDASEEDDRTAVGPGAAMVSEAPRGNDSRREAPRGARSLPGVAERLPSAPRGGPRPDGTERTDGVPNQLQDLIRQAFGAEMLEPPRQLAGGTGGRQPPDAARRNAPPRADTGPNGGRTEGQQPDRGAKPAGPRGQPQARTDRNTQGQHGQDGGERAGGAKQAGAGGASATGLFGTQPVAEQSAGHAKTFHLKLSSFGAAFRAEVEPQVKRGAESVPAVASPAPQGEPPALNPRQSADDPMQRNEIPPEHEATVRQIFSRKE